MLFAVTATQEHLPPVPSIWAIVTALRDRGVKTFSDREPILITPVRSRRLGYRPRLLFGCINDDMVHVLDKYTCCTLPRSAIVYVSDALYTAREPATYVQYQLGCLSPPSVTVFSPSPNHKRKSRSNK
jgi:hypothetical protein